MNDVQPIKFKATQVFSECWDAINTFHTDEKGNQVRTYRIFEQVGGSRSSKTWSDFQIAFMYSYTHRNKIGTVMRDTAADCRDKVETDWKQWLKDPNLRVKQFEAGEITSEELDYYLRSEDLSQYIIENKSNHSWTFKQSGSVITFTGTDDEDRAIGKSQNWLWVNEPYKFSEEVFKQLTQRTSDFVIVDWNPKQNHFIEKLRLKPDTFTHRSNLTMNPFCPLESRKQILSYQPLKHAKVVSDNRLKEKDAHTYDTAINPKSFTEIELKELVRCIQNENQQTSSEYHYKVFFLGEKAEKPNRVFHFHKITRREYDALDVQIYHAVDWGKSDPWGIIEGKYYDGALYLRELNYKSENAIREKLSADESRQFTPEEQEEGNEKGTGIVTWMFRKLAIPEKSETVCDNNRPLKIAALRRAGWEYAFPAPKGKGSIKDGIDLVDNITVYYTDDSPNLEYEQENYSWKTDRYGIRMEEPEDIDNHLMDPTRYLATYLQKKGIIKII